MTVWVTVLVLVLVLTLVLGVVEVVVVVVVVVVVGSVVVVVVVVVGSVVVGAVVSVAEPVVDVVTGADLLVVVIGVIRGGSAGVPPKTSLAMPYTNSATTTAPNAPDATSVTGLRNQATGSPAG